MASYQACLSWVLSQCLGWDTPNRNVSGVRYSARRGLIVVFIAVPSQQIETTDFTANRLVATKFRKGTNGTTHGWQMLVCLATVQNADGHGWNTAPRLSLSPEPTSFPSNTWTNDWVEEAVERRVKWPHLTYKPLSMPNWVTGTVCAFYFFWHVRSPHARDIVDERKRGILYLRQSMIPRIVSGR